MLEVVGTLGWREGGEECSDFALTRVKKGDSSGQKDIPRIIEGMESDRRIHGSKAISYKAETEGRNEYEQRPGDGMAGQMCRYEKQRDHEVGYG